MQEIFDQQLKEVRSHYESGDLDLGLRRLLDCAIETEDADVFRAVLDFCEYLESQEVMMDASLEKVSALLEMIGKAGARFHRIENQDILSLSHVGKQYQNSGFAIKDISFDLSLGSIMGLVGENGNGKTTLLRLIAGELKADKGEVTYPFARAQDEYDLKSKLIYIEQRIPRWYGSLMDNLIYTTAHYHENWKNHRLWAEIMIARLGLRPYRNLTWGRISSGYRTRFELAKTLLRRPKLLLLDEPLANLDIVAQQTILQDLKYMANSLSAPFAMILSSQHIYEVEKVSDSILFLRQGAAQWDQKNQADSDSSLILELEVNVNRELLKKALSPLNLQKIQFNGGVFLVHLSSNHSSAQVLSELAKHEVEVHYFRNISQSSRRFFIQ